MPLHIDPTAASEANIVVLRKEGEMTRPPDTQCKALTEDGQCAEEITFDMEGDYWSKLCEVHHIQDREARQSGEPRVERV